MAKKAKSVYKAESLLGIEGTAAKLYFSGLSTLIHTDGVFKFENRNRRPPRDPVNALLSFVYAILVKEVTVAVHACGFDPMLGFFHRPRYGRPSLALDLAEEFRPLIGDSIVLTLINNGEITEEHFVRRAGAVALTGAGRRAVLAAIERRMESLVTHPIFKCRISYRRILEVQARLLARVVTGEIEAYPSFCSWGVEGVAASWLQHIISILSGGHSNEDEMDQWRLQEMGQNLGRPRRRPPPAPKGTAGPNTNLFLTSRPMSSRF